jgi:heterodisulfide reductase subunit A-like polyferredoxin
MTDSEVIDVKGHAGDFNVRVRHHPRYIDLEKCVGVRRLRQGLPHSHS